MKKLKVGNYVHISSKKTILINGKLDMIGLVSYFNGLSFNFTPIENMNTSYTRATDCNHTDIIAIYSKEEMIELYPEYFI
jgi:hypothetical protein